LKAGAFRPDDEHTLRILEHAMQVVTQTAISEYPLAARGKVRDIYEIDAETLLLVTTDRMSAFDVIMAEPIPYKGVVLNQITLFWMKRFEHVIPNHLQEWDVARFPAPLQKYADVLEGRSVLVRKARPLALECIVRGHLAGSGWKDYRATGMLCGHALPKGLRESSKLEKVLFTPSTKAALGTHDENITEEQGEGIVGKAVYGKARDASIAIFSAAREYAETRGLIIADTKFEFGMLGDGLILIDEALTPDSSRFWPLAGYAPGQSQPSFDKQFLRDWLEKQPWNKTPPPPPLPADVVRTTSEKYLEAYAILTGAKLKIPA
jgi:phosphoribosylaminoimidazole-succinocarboxamide synthase